jgi:hypothetical protein
LARALFECVVAVRSKLQRPAGGRGTTPAPDALHLARLLQLGEILAVKIPSVVKDSSTRPAISAGS